MLNRLPHTMYEYQEDLEDEINIETSIDVILLESDSRVSKSKTSGGGDGDRLKDHGVDSRNNKGREDAVEESVQLLESNVTENTTNLREVSRKTSNSRSKLVVSAVLGEADVNTTREVSSNNKSFKVVTVTKVQIEVKIHNLACLEVVGSRADRKSLCGNNTEAKGLLLMASLVKLIKLKGCTNHLEGADRTTLLCKGERVTLENSISTRVDDEGINEKVKHAAGRSERDVVTNSITDGTLGVGNLTIERKSNVVVVDEHDTLGEAKADGTNVTNSSRGGDSSSHLCSSSGKTILNCVMDSLVDKVADLVLEETKDKVEEPSEDVSGESNLSSGDIDINLADGN